MLIVCFPLEVADANGERNHAHLSFLWQFIHKHRGMREEFRPCPTSNGMFKLLDRAFWKFLSGFVLILIVSFSILTIFGAWREAKDSYSQLIRVFQHGK